ncbi:glycosyltransferase family 4 protein [Phosphitispora sp. TUW77]|uniref:glycosyltransferase family 4 protein n=1 Tax=Phosphitispora sp. TUW77 TaxID=3152361 RepID=UPI003AB22C59
MKIVMLSWEYPPKSVGGLAQHVHQLSKALAKHGAEVHVITIGADNVEPYEENEGVRVHRIYPYSISAPDFRTWILHLNFSMLEYAVTLINSIKGVDIVHAHDWLAAFAGRALKHSFSVPLVATIHATEFGRNNGLHNDNQRYISDVEWYLSFESWKVIVCSSFMYRELKGFFQLPEDKLRIIPNGVTIEDFETNTVYHDEGDEKYIFYIGRLVREKGVQVLIDAAPKILSYFPEARFVIAGTGPYEEHLRAMVREKRLGHRFYFTGYIDDTTRNRWFSQSSVAVFPSLYEPFGIVALEAMAAKTPVVVCDTGGLSEIIDHGRDGMKCYVGSSNSLADNIMAILGDKTLANRLSVNGYEKARKKYSWFSIASQTLEVYEEILDQSKRADWHTDTWRASDPLAALYGKVKNLSRANVSGQRAH